MSKYKFNISSNIIAGYECAFHDGRVQYTDLEAFGNSLEECLENATIGRMDWHGNDFEAVPIGDLSSRLYDHVEAYIKQVCCAE